jgi:predicted phage-related endonuclease
MPYKNLMYVCTDRLPWKTTSRTLLLGASVGALISGLQAFRTHFEPLREELRKTKEATKVDSEDQTEGSEVGTASSKRDADSR